MRNITTVITTVTLAALCLFVVQGVIHKGYVHLARFDPASERCNAMHGDLATASMGPRGKCIDEMLAAMAEGNDFLWFLR